MSLRHQGQRVSLILVEKYTMRGLKRPLEMLLDARHKSLTYRQDAVEQLKKTGSPNT